MTDTLTKAVFQEMNQLIDNGPTSEDLAKVKETSIRERETNEKQNNYWLSAISFAEQMGCLCFLLKLLKKKFKALQQSKFRMLPVSFF